MTIFHYSTLLMQHCQVGGYALNPAVG